MKKRGKTKIKEKREREKCCGKKIINNLKGE